MGLAALLLGSLVPVGTLAFTATATTRQRTIASALAASQLERLRSLPWYALAGGGEARDATTLLQPEAFLPGGPGLAPAAVQTLDVQAGAYGDIPPPAGALPDTGEFTRRWTVTTLPSDPACVVLIVEVASTAALAAGQSMSDAAVGRAQTVRCRAGATP